MDFKNFLNIPPKYSNLEESKTVIIPFPFENSTSFGKGTKFGPKAIISASSQVELFDEELEKETYKEVGIHTTSEVKPGDSPEKFYLPLTKKVKEIVFSNKFPIILGGEHTISLGGVLGLGEKYKSFSVLHFDAHADLRDSYEGNKFSHASAMRRVLDQKEVKNLVSVGIRNISNNEDEGSEFDFYKGNQERIKIFWAKDKIGLSIEKILENLEENVYLTFDVDAFDPSIMPSTGTPEPGGLLWNEVIEILRQVFLKKNVIAIDIVELSPIKNMPAPDFMIAKMVYKMIGHKFL
ncbi:MAG: agmatinase [Candidatus Staskawiczbacteria bacterium]|nr:agmatinase [Candidatus Staskawiczbacteria bacterium]